MSKLLISLGVSLVFVILAVTLSSAHAAAGLPESPSFGYGARLDLWGEQVSPAVNAAAGLSLDWIAVDFDWERSWPEPNAMPDLNALGAVIAEAQKSNIQVLLTITHVPAWALTPQGPEPNLTAALVLAMAQIYPGGVDAVELIPGANTLAGWGAAPDPAAYAQLLRLAQENLQKYAIQLPVVTGGLVPLAAGHSAEDMDDRLFLQGLYQAGAMDSMPIIGVRYPQITGDPMMPPSEQEQRILRHFEELRTIMLQNNHSSGLIWVTGFAWPEGGLQPGDQAYLEETAQAYWLSSAYRLLRAQLYIGAAFFSQLNPSAALANGLSSASLIRPDGSLHPAAVHLGQYATIDGSPQSVTFQGSISKRTPMKLDLKPDVP